MTFRAYFNRHREAPQVCSIDEGTQDSEINVLGFVVHGCSVISRYNGVRANENTPSFWIEIEADSYRVLDGIVHFTSKAAE